MNIEADWDQDDVGDELHSKLFNKNKKKVKKPKGKISKSDSKPVTLKKDNIKLNVAKLSLNITKKLQTILTKPEESVEKNENQKQKTNEENKNPTIKGKKKQNKFNNKVAPILNKKGPKVKKKLKRLEKKPKIASGKAPKVQNSDDENSEEPEPKIEKPVLNKIHKLSGLNINNLRTALAKRLEQGEKKEVSLREKMMDRLNVAKFRYINEQMYTVDGSAAQKIFKEDPEAFTAYHEGYYNQACKWPVNPLDIIIESIKKMSSDLVVGDFGCGNANLESSVPQQVHSFDLVAVKPQVTECEMSKVPLKNASLDVAVYCLSLMGTNLRDYFFEANRLLKMGGILKIAEVESRFEEVSVDDFIGVLKKFGFKLTWRDLSHNLFYFLDFVKERNLKQKNKLPTLTLKPCLYKKR